MTHKFSKEILYHFNCGKCNKWWSIADYHLSSKEVRSYQHIQPSLITCPHCGHKKEVKEIENDEKRRLD
jgi:DNA-directed RNA polymerase subunit RPC12/RpoP